MALEERLDPVDAGAEGVDVPGGDAHGGKLNGRQLRSSATACDQPVDVLVARCTARCPARTAPVVAEPGVPRGLDRVEVAGGGVDAASGEVFVDLAAGVPSTSNSTVGVRRAGRPCSGDAVEGAELRRAAGRRSRSSYSSTAVIDSSTRARRSAASRGEVGDEVDRRGHAGEQLVGQRAELEALRHRVGGGQQLVRVQRLEQRGRGGQRAEVRAEELVRRAGEEVGAERRHVDRGVRGEVHARRRTPARPPRGRPRRSRGTSGRVPSRLEAAGDRDQPGAVASARSRCRRARRSPGRSRASARSRRRARRRAPRGGCWRRGRAG